MNLIKNLNINFNNFDEINLLENKINKNGKLKIKEKLKILIQIVDGLNYIIDEINRLIENNTNKVVKTNVVNFVLEILINLFDSFNFDISNPPRIDRTVFSMRKNNL